MAKVETSVIYCGDNRDVLAKFPAKSIDLIYADPPFFSNKQYEIVWGRYLFLKNSWIKPWINLRHWAKCRVRTLSRFI